MYIQALSVLRESDCNFEMLKNNSVFAGLEKYRTLLHEKGYLDYTAIIEEAIHALESDEHLRGRLKQRLKVVIVDEYQDLNPIQERLVQLLFELGADVKVVGDDDQTIYQWRGSDVQNILTFKDRYKPADDIRLEDNFRSSDGIVSVADFIIRKNKERLEKTMRSTRAQVYEDGDIVALQFDTPEAEAAHIAETCRALRGTYVLDQEGQRRAISWSDMSVLLRANVSGEPIREALRAAGIPFVSVGMNALFDAVEAEAARQLFYLMGNGASEEEVLNAWIKADLGVSEKVLKQTIADFVVTREKMVNESDQVRFAVYNIQRQFIAFLETIELTEEKVPAGRGETVFYNLAKFSQLISDFEAINFHSAPVQKYESFRDFLKYQAERVYEVGAIEENFISPDAVQIVTVHKAKGLQWPVVFVPQLVRNRFPGKRQGGLSVWHLLPQESVIGQARYLGSIEDERRLFYVAVTRSQKHLHMTTAPTPGNQLYAKPSEFWFDVLESKYVKRRTVDYATREHGEPQPRSSVADVVLTFSDLKYFFECPYQFKLRTLYGFNAPLAEALGYGKSLHDALSELHARAIEGKEIESGMAKELVERHMRVPYAYPELRRTLMASAEKVIEQYIEKRKAEFNKIEFSEKNVEVRLGDGVTVAGRIDLVRSRDTDEIAIVDLKSSEDSQPQELTEAQLHIYALGYRDLTGKNADYVETYELDKQNRISRPVDEVFVDDVKARVQDAASALRKNEFPANPKKQICGRCDFARLCASRA